MKDIQDLNRRDLNTLDRELSTAVHKMSEQMHEERDTTDTDWLHKLSVKFKICEQFLTRVRDVRDNDLSKIEAYHLLYFRQAVSNVLGPLQADELFQESRQEAFRQLNKESLP
jgi:hypothetical protein|tara:strand:- start:675 stop:1013 length:339 start_codon:yes stop_codon:yes gene_type:complete